MILLKDQIAWFIKNMEERDIIRILKISKVHTFLVGITMMAILLCCSSQVQASQDGDYEYSVTDRNAQITLYTGAGGVVTIPSNLGGFPVTSIDDCAFFYYTNITSIIIPQGLTNIGNSAFAGCSRLTSITIPQGVKSIGGGAFYKCLGLDSIRFNSATTKIYDDSYTIPPATKIIGYDPSTANDYAIKYSREFEIIGITPDTSGMTEMTTASSIVAPSKVWTIKLNALVNEDSIKDQIYVTDSQGLNKQVPACTVATVNGGSQIKVTPANSYTPGDYILWVKDIKTVKGTKLKSQVYLKFTVK